MSASHMRTGRYVLQRLLWAGPTLIGITLVTFLMTRLAPGDPAAARLGDAAETRITPLEHERLRAYMGLDRPVIEQYGRWLWRALRLDFGHSWRSGRRVAEQIGERLGPTLALAIAALGLSALLAVPMGLLAAARAGGFFDRLCGTVSAALYAIPNYAAALLLLALLSVKLGWLPASGRRSLEYESLGLAGQMADVVRHSVLILACLVYPWWAYQVRFVRNTALDALAAPFVAAVRAKGVSEWRIQFRHVLPHTLIALLTLIGLGFPAVVSGAVVLEYVFSWPGLGGLLVDSLFARDYPVIMALTVLTAGIVLLVNLAVDIAYGLLDPRVRHG